MDRAIENVMRVAGVSLVEAIAMATVNPARVAQDPIPTAVVDTGRTRGPGEVHRRRWARHRERSLDQRPKGL